MVFLLMAVFAFPAGASDVFQEANQQFENGQFDQAIEAYEQVLEGEGPRVSVLNNLGSAYFRTGDYARAILAFERALILSPGDRALLANLKLSQEQAAVFPEPPVRGWRGFFGSVSPDTRAVVALLAALICPLVAVLWVRSRGRRAGWAIAFLLLSLTVPWMVLRPMEGQVDPRSRAVVLATPATVRLSPFEAADSRGTLAGGREVVLGEMKNGYYWIDANNGATQGWVHGDEVASILPVMDDEPL
ncbi:MAG: tetratricopeptide repeat protein [Haloferula sp.]